MENLSVNLRSADNPRLDVDLATDASGFCEIYVMPGDYDYDPDYEKPFYPSERKSIQVSDEEFELLLCDKFVILKLVIVICLRRIIVEKERKI